MSPTRVPSTPQAREAALRPALAALLAADPGFDLDALLLALRPRYLEVQAALAGDDPERLAEIATPDLLEQWRELAQRRLDAGLREAGPEVTIQDLRPMWAESGSQEERLVVAIDSFTEPDGRSPVALTEYWTLVRPADAVTAPPGAAAECTRCGAPQDGTASICRYCGAAAPGPLQPWRLAAVDEELEWVDVPGEAL